MISRDPASKVQALKDALEKLHPTIEQICKKSSSPGIPLGVVYDGEIIHRANFGYRDVLARTKPDSDTIYSIGSMTKALTAAAVGMLVEDGLLQWDTPFREILPDFGEGLAEIGGMITCVDLLSHRTGMASPDTFFYQDSKVLLLKKGEEIKTFNHSEQKYGFR